MIVNCSFGIISGINISLPPLGKLFTSCLISGYISIKNAEGIERAWLNGASTPEDDIIIGIGGTKEANNPPFKVIEDGSIHAANGKFKALADGSIDMEFRKTVSDGDIIITINSSTGIISTRKEGDTNSVAQISVDGIIANSGKTQVLPLTSGIEFKASLAGLGFGNVEKDTIGNATLCGVYGDANNSNSDPSPTFGGYFQKLKANGLFLSVKSITSNYTVTMYDSIISCYNTSNISVTLPSLPYIGQIIRIRRNQIYDVNVIAGDGRQLLLADSQSASIIGAKGDCVQVMWDGSYWLWNDVNV